MKPARIIKISLRQLQINKTRSAFAAVALSLGVAAVVSMAAIGNGARTETLKQLELLGTNLITVNAGKIMNVINRKDRTDRITTLQLKDCEAILNAGLPVKEIVPSITGSIKVKAGTIADQCMINGVTSSYFAIRDFQVQYGDLFTGDDNICYRRVAVLGSEVNRRLFDSKNSIGEIIMIGKVPFEVTGILKSKGFNADGGNLDVQIIIPINTAMRRIFNLDYLNHIFVAVNEQSQMKTTESGIESALRESHKLNLLGKKNDFTIENQLTAIETSKNSASSFTWLIVGVSGLALLVGGIGIMAVMLLSVRMRNAEIGLRLSAGAKRKDIISQFLTESSILGFAGGVTGILAGLAFSLTMDALSIWNVAISPVSMVISVLFSLITGLIFGVIPARKASLADPIKALQKE